MSQRERRAYQVARTLPCAALVLSLMTSQGCAKFHNKLHKHKTDPVFGTYPASEAPYAGLASVSPQMSPVVTGPVTYSSTQAGTSVPAQAPETGSAATSPPAMPPMDQPPKAETPKPVNVPAETAKPAEAAKAATTPPTPPAETPKPAAGAAKPPATNPGINLPPPANDLPLLPPPGELPPPPAAPGTPPRSTSTAPAAGATGSPFAANPGAVAAQVATNQPVTSSPTLTLSLPGGGDAPPPPPADEKPMPTLAPAQPPVQTPQPAPAQQPAPALNVKPAANGVKTSSTPVGGTSEAAKLDAILQKTSATLAGIGSYRVDVSSQETVNGKTHPVDQFVLYKRRQPLAVRMEWGQGKEAGREVIFSPTENKGMIQIRMPKGLIPRMSMSPDSPLVRAKSRHPINEAGFDAVVERLNETLNLTRRNAPNAGQISVQSAMEPNVGQVDRITHLTTTGETWVVDLEAKSGLPLTIHATDNSGKLLEHIEFRNFQFNLAELQTAAAFDPNARWGQPKLLGGLARGKTDDSTKR